MRVTRKRNPNVDVSRVGPTRVLKLHMTTGDTLAHYIIEKETTNMRLKRNIIGPK